MLVYASITMKILILKYYLLFKPAGRVELSGGGGGGVENEIFWNPL